MNGFGIVCCILAFLMIAVIVTAVCLIVVVVKSYQLRSDKYLYVSGEIRLHEGARREGQYPEEQG